jgi:hypothetical protein
MTDSITCDTPTQISRHGKTLQLADNFQPDVDLLVGEGLIAFGVKGSGKSNLVARRAHCSYKDAKTWVERIQAQGLEAR